MKITSGMYCYDKLNDTAKDELNKIGMQEARGNSEKLEGAVELDTDNIRKITAYGINYYLPESGQETELRFNNMKLKQPDYDSFLLAYNSVKDNDVSIDINV